MTLGYLRRRLSSLGLPKINGDGSPNKPAPSTKPAPNPKPSVAIKPKVPTKFNKTFESKEPKLPTTSASTLPSKQQTITSALQPPSSLRKASIAEQDDSSTSQPKRPLPNVPGGNTKIGNNPLAKVLPNLPFSNTLRPTNFDQKPDQHKPPLTKHEQHEQPVHLEQVDFIPLPLCDKYIFFYYLSPHLCFHNLNQNPPICIHIPRFNPFHMIFSKPFLVVFNVFILTSYKALDVKA